MAVAPPKRTSKSAGNGKRPRVKAGANRIAGFDGAQMLSMLSAIVERRKIAGQLGKSFDGDRDLYTALGYKLEPKVEDYIAKYRRQDIAQAVIRRPVDACWRLQPVITESEEDETPFEVAWTGMATKLRLFHYFARVDRITRLGEYGVLVIGFQSAESDLAKEVGRASEIAYVMPYSAASVKIIETEDKTDSPRFSLPLIYDITMKSGQSTTQRRVHWSRVIHISEDNLENDTHGTPALESVFNRLQDLEKVAGASAEGYWLGAFPGLTFNVAPDAKIGTQDLPDFKDQIDEYEHGLRRMLRLQGIDVKSLAIQVADPSKHIDILLTLIAAGKEIPKRILMGSERGELSSSQDERGWMMTVDARRRQHCEPTIIRQFIDRCITVGALPVPPNGYTVVWPDLLTRSDKEIAEVGQMRAATLKAYVEAIGAESIVPLRLALKKLLGFTQEEIDQAAAMVDEDSRLANDNELDSDGDGDE